MSCASINTLEHILYMYNRNITNFSETNIDCAQIRIMYQMGCTPLYIVSEIGDTDRNWNIQSDHFSTGTFGTCFKGIKDPLSMSLSEIVLCFFMVLIVRMPHLRYITFHISCFCSVTIQVIICIWSKA